MQKALPKDGNRLFQMHVTPPAKSANVYPDRALVSHMCPQKSSSRRGTRAQDTYPIAGVPCAPTTTWLHKTIKKVRQATIGSLGMCEKHCRKVLCVFGRIACQQIWLLFFGLKVGKNNNQWSSGTNSRSIAFCSINVLFKWISRKDGRDHVVN